MIFIKKNWPQQGKFSSTKD